MGRLVFYTTQPPPPFLPRFLNDYIWNVFCMFVFTELASDFSLAAVFWLSLHLAPAFSSGALSSCFSAVAAAVVTCWYVLICVCVHSEKNVEIWTFKNRHYQTDVHCWYLDWLYWPILMLPLSHYSNCNHIHRCSRCVQTSASKGKKCIFESQNI